MELKFEPSFFTNYDKENLELKKLKSKASQKKYSECEVLKGSWSLELTTDLKKDLEFSFDDDYHKKFVFVTDQNDLQGLDPLLKDYLLKKQSTIRVWNVKEKLKEQKIKSMIRNSLLILDLNLSGAFMKNNGKHTSKLNVPFITINQNNSNFQNTGNFLSLNNEKLNFGKVTLKPLNNVLRLRIGKDNQSFQVISERINSLLSYLKEKEVTTSKIVVKRAQSNPKTLKI